MAGTNNQTQLDLATEELVFVKHKPEIQIKKQTALNLLREYLLILWDGLSFFGADETKLARLKGVKVTFIDKFKNK